MDSARWDRIQAVFHDAAALPPGEQRAFVENACAGDEPLMADVLAMLEEDARGASLLDRDVARVANTLLGRGDSTVKQFGPYRIATLLGEGGMGIVYLAERPDLGSRAAIKILRDAWLSPARRDRFAAEQRTLAQLSHASIARLYDADTLADGTPWFAMEYVEGVPLTDYCRKHASSIRDRLRIVRDVCDAVQYAHSHAIIHRDLKPSNILVQADATVKLLDFGIAKQLDRTDSPEDRTRTGLRLMTLAYAAPEQIRGAPAGIYTDVYSLGVILYELLTGRLPFDFSSLAPGEAETAILNQQPEKPSLRAARGESWGDLDVLCLTAMHKEPERRYRSVEALSRDIDHYLAGEPLEARPDSLAYRAGKFVRRNRRAVAAAALVFALVASLTVFYTRRLAAARNQALAEAARAERVLRFTLNLFDGGDKEAGPASDLRVKTLIDRGVAEAASLDRDPRVQAELNQTLGEVYQKLGDLGRADALLTSAFERRQADIRADPAGAADAGIRLGLLRSDQAKFDDAERLVREALSTATRTLPPGHPAIAAATHALGKVLEDRGAYDRAIAILQDAVRLRSAPGADPRDLAESLLELSNAQFYAGHLAEAEALNRRLLDMHRALFGERHPLVAEDLINLGAIQQELGNYRAAEQFHRQALEITQSFYGRDHFKTASNLTLIARALLKQERIPEAVDLLKQALAIQEKVFGKVHPRVASALNELGTAALARNNYGEAEADFSREVEIYRTVYRGRHYLIGIAQSNLASVYMARKQYTRAEPVYRQALAMFLQTLPPGQLNTGIVQIKLGRVLLRESRFAEAEEETLAGYRILSAQANPSVSWLKNARQDLVEIYTALHQPQKAAAFRAEQASLTPKP